MSRIHKEAFEEGRSDFYKSLNNKNYMITSTSSSQVKNVMALQKKSKARRENHQFVVEGIKMVKEAPADRVVKVYVSETFENANEIYMKELKESISEKLIESVSDTVFLRMSDTQTPQGIMAIVKMADYELLQIVTKKDEKAPLIIGVENLQDPGNLGTIVRMAEGAGVTGVVISSNSVDIYNPKTIRSTMGSIYRVPIVCVNDFLGSIKKLQDSGVRVYAAHLDGQKNYVEPDYTKGTAFLIGNEGNGLTKQSTDMADELIRIPMCGEVESLNAAIACTVLTYEAMKQRS